MRKLVLVAALVTACSDNAVTVGNSNPLGIVAGIVIDAANEMPLAGAMVKLIAADKTLTATTDMDGVFRVLKVPSGSFILTVSITGYQTALINDVLNGAVGNFP